MAISPVQGPQVLPFAYSRDTLSQESLSLGTGVFAPRQPLSEQVHQRSLNSSCSCKSNNTTSTNNNLALRSFNALSVQDYECRYHSNNNSTYSLASTSSSRSSSTSSLSSNDSLDDNNSFYDSAYSSVEKSMASTSTRAAVRLNPTSKAVSCTDTNSTRVTLNTLPAEIRVLIAQECLQADAFHLCLTSRNLYESTVSRLYQCIVFDSAHRHFNKEISYKRLKPGRFKNKNGSAFNSSTNYTPNDSYFSYTSVRTVGGLRRCMRTLRSDNVKASYVRRFECLNSMDLPDLEIREFVKEVFPHMPNLACLIWDASPEITVDLVQQIACPERIETLCLDLALRNDTISRSITQMAFPMLTHLTIRPYMSSDFLEMLARMVANSPDTMRNLRSLYLGRELHKSHEVGSGFAFASMNPQNGQGGGRTVDEQALQSFFGTLLKHSKTQRKLQLTQLGLDGITVHGSDFEILDQCVEFSTITHLYLAGTDITGTPENDAIDQHNDQYDTWSPRLLSCLSFKLKKLHSLELDWSETAVDTVPTFLLTLPQRLRALSVKIRWNNSKARYLEWEPLCIEYAEAIVARHSRCLKQLAIDGVEDMAFYDPFKAITSSALLELASCDQLTGLSIPAPSPPPQPISSLDHLLGSLPKLRFFHLRNQHTKAYLGQNVSYLIEDWLRYKNVVEALTKAQMPSRALEFIKLEEYIFDVRERNQPGVIREGLLSWFDAQVFQPWEI